MSVSAKIADAAPAPSAPAAQPHIELVKPKPDEELESWLALQAEAEACRRWCDDARPRFGSPLEIIASLSHIETRRLGLSAHEIGHGAVAAGCGAVVDHITLARAPGEIGGYMRPVASAGSFVAQIAILLAGGDALAKATGDVVRAWDSAGNDRKDLKALLLQVGTGRSAERTILDAEETVHAVLFDDECWHSIVGLSTDLARRPSGRMGGEEFHARLVLPYRVRATVARIIGSDRSHKPLTLCGGGTS